MSFDEFEEKFLSWCPQQYRLRLVFGLVAALTFGLILLIAFIVRWLN